jgi:23S rRNA pseudouridine1911/1915/1917 synthase
MVERRVELEAEEGKVRIDKFLANRLSDLSRAAVQRQIENGQVSVNGEPVKSSYKVSPGDRIVVTLPLQRSDELVPEAIPLDIVFEDQALLAINKVAGMVVHPAPGHKGGTLVNALLAHSPELAASGGQRPGVVHRLDRDTSGLILVAKNEKAKQELQRQFKDRTVDKAYLALVNGHLQPAWGRIEAPIGRDPHHRQRMAVLAGGREAVTEYHVLETFSHRWGSAAGDYSLLEAHPITGRTHQIRVHLASIGHPVVGDGLYGQRKCPLPLARHFLHAQKITFRHPLTRYQTALEAPLPKDLAQVLEVLRSG